MFRSLCNTSRFAIDITLHRRSLPTFLERCIKTWNNTFVPPSISDIQKTSSHQIQPSLQFSRPKLAHPLKSPSPNTETHKQLLSSPTNSLTTPHPSSLAMPSYPLTHVPLLRHHLCRRQARKTARAILAAQNGGSEGTKAEKDKGRQVVGNNNGMEISNGGGGGGMGERLNVECEKSKGK